MVCYGIPRAIVDGIRASAPADIIACSGAGIAPINKYTFTIETAAGHYGVVIDLHIRCPVACRTNPKPHTCRSCTLTDVPNHIITHLHTITSPNNDARGANVMANIVAVDVMIPMA